MLPFDRSARRVRIAVIDSGVQPSHPHIRADRILPGVAFLAADQSDHAAEATIDRVGHGTAVAAAIQEKAPEADLIPVRVFHDTLMTSAGTLLAAIDWSIAQGADIINLSLGTTNLAHSERFAAAVGRALAAGALIVAPRNANDLACLPGSLDGVLGVDLDWDCPRDRYRAVDDVAFASGYPRPIAGVPPVRNVYGISFAAAQMSGFAARELTAMLETGQSAAFLKRRLLLSEIESSRPDV